MAVTNSHPTFVNPTIQEAICELHFRLSGDQRWKPDYPAIYFQAIQGEFPNFEPVAHTAMQMRIGVDGIEQSLTSQVRTRYRHGMRSMLLQLSDNLLVINELRPYVGWRQMQADVLAAWHALRSTIPVASIERIGLRYINRVLRSEPEESPSLWLRPGPFVPAAVLSFSTTFSSRVAASLNASSRAIVQVSTIDEDPLIFMFDIDCILEREIDLEEQALVAALDELHSAVWDIFDNARTDHFTTYLQG